MREYILALVSLTTLFCTIVESSAAQDPDEFREERLEGHLVTPAKITFDESLLEQVTLPDGFSINAFATDLENPRMIVVSDDGTVFATIREEDKVLALRDTNGDGQADQITEVFSDIEMVHGVTIHNGELYLVNDKELYKAPLNENGEAGELTLLTDDLPDGGQHPNRTIAFGPDNRLYISVGSTCNACDETNPEHATLLQSDASGNDRTIYAEGLRNTIGFAWHPETEELWGMDHGSDWRGDDIPEEELNLIEEGNHYGWPFVYGDQEIDPYLSSEPEGMTREEFARQSEPPVMTYTAHTAPMDMVFYDGDQFPEEYQNDAFVAFRGSWNRKPAVGYKISRIRFDDEGQPQEFEDFVTGFLQEDEDSQSHFGRLTGVAVHTDGSLLFTDDSNGVIYRVSYDGN